VGDPDASLGYYAIQLLDADMAVITTIDHTSTEDVAQFSARIKLITGVLGLF
jgi:hypothetical protein